VSICTHWDYTCEGEYQEICSEYEEQPIESECREFGFVCEMETLLQPECVGRSLFLSDRIERARDEMDVILVFQELMSNLHDSVLNLLDLDDLSRIIDIAWINATQSLNEIRTSDEIQFTFGVEIFPEWSVRYFSMLHSNELVNELEEDIITEQEDSDLEIVRLQTNIDFDSTEQTAILIANEVEMVI